MSTIESILSIANKLFGLKGAIIEEDLAKRERIAKFLQDLATTTIEVETVLRREEQPAIACSKMYAMSKELEGVIGDYSFDFSIKLSDILNELREAYDAGMMLWEIENVENQEENYRKLAEAAGLFQALAVTICAKG